MNTPLEQVAKAFDDWRATKPKPNRIPKDLITQTLSLLNQYHKSEIIRRLGINHGTLSRWIRTQLTAEDTFIALPAMTTNPASPDSTPTNSNTLDVSINFASGAKLTLVGTASVTALFISNLQQRGAL